MVRAVFSSLHKATKSKQETILAAATVIAIIYCFSALLGFIRNRLLSGYFGDTTELGLYFAADDIPNLIFSFVVSGALSTSFIPIFGKYHKNDPEEAWKVTRSIINISLFLFIAFLIIVFFFSDFIVGQIMARNSHLSPEDLKLYAKLLEILMIAQLCFIISSFYTSILQSFNHFIVPALAPVMLNVGVIIFLLLFYSSWGIYAPAWGTVFGAFLHMIIQMPMARNLGFKYKPTWNWRHIGVKDFYRMMIPRTMGQTAQKLIIPLYTNLALYISGASNVILTFADDLQGVPVRIFGMSIGQAALPIFSTTYNEENPSEFKKLLNKTLYQVVFFVLPISVLVFVLRVPLVRLAYGAKKFSWEATVMTAYTLAFFSISIVTQALILILARGFYTLCDTKTPFKISTFSIVINAILAIGFVKYLGLGIWSLAFAYALANFVNTIILLKSLMKKLKDFDLYDLLYKVNRIALASYIMGVMLYVPLKIFDTFVFDTTRTFDLILLTGTVTLIGLITYVSLVRFFRLRELDYTYYIFANVNSFIKGKFKYSPNTLLEEEKPFS